MNHISRLPTRFYEEPYLLLAASASAFCNNNAIKSKIYNILSSKDNLTPVDIYQLASIEINDNKLDQAIKRIKNTLLIEPDFNALRLQLLKAYIKREEWSKVLEQSLYLLENQKWEVDYMGSIAGMAAMKAETNNAVAIKCFEKSIEASGTYNHEFIFRYLTLLKDSGMNNKYEEVLQKIDEEGLKELLLSDTNTYYNYYK